MVTATDQQRHATDPHLEAGREKYAAKLTETETLGEQADGRTDGRAYYCSDPTTTEGATIHAEGN